MNRAAAAILGFGAMVAGLWSRNAQASVPAGDQRTAQPYAYDDAATGRPTFWEPLPVPSAPVAVNNSARNRKAFGDMVAKAEGTLNAGGYAALYGSTPSRPRTFASYADHPRVASRISSTDNRWTSAAGRYQFMAVSPIPGGGSTKVNTWDRLKAKLGLPDFSPASQERAFIELLAERGALADVDAGRVVDAARKVRAEWASLPGAGYGQGERSEAYVIAAYKDAGGVTA